METDIHTELENADNLRRSSRSRSTTPGINNITSVMHSQNSDISTEKRTEAGKKSVITSTSKTVVKSRTLAGKSTVQLSSIHESSQENPIVILKNIAKEKNSLTHDTTLLNNKELRSEKQRAKRYNSKNVVNGTENDGTPRTTRKLITRSAPTKTSDYSSDDDIDEKSKEEYVRRMRAVYDGLTHYDVLPKTDFTYSSQSPNYYKEVAPGVKVKPNMSRSTYQHYAPSTNVYHTENVIHTPYRPDSRTSYTSETTSTARKSRFFDASAAGVRVPSYVSKRYASPDSDEDEVDTNVRAAAAAARKTSSATYFTSFFTTIWTVITTTWTTTVETVQNTFGMRNNAAGYGYSTPIRRPQSYSWWQKVMDFIYFSPINVMIQDLGLLSTSEEATDLGKRRRLKYFAWLLLFLLLLFSGAWWLLSNTEENVIIPRLYEPLTPLRNLFGYLGEQFRWLGTLLGSWLFLPFMARQSKIVESSTIHVHNSRSQPPPLTVTTPLGSTSPTFEKVEMSVFIDQLLESEQFEEFMATRQDKFSREDLIAEILGSTQLQNWIQLKLNEKEVDVEALTLQIIASRQFEKSIAASRKPIDLKALSAEIWGTGQLQQFINVFLEEKKKMFLLAHLEEQERDKERGSINIDLLRISLQQELDEKSKHFEVHNAKLAGEIEQLKADFGKKLNASINEMKGRLKDEGIRLDEIKHSQEEEIQILKEQLKRCCNKQPPALPLDDIEKHVLRYMAGVYGMNNAEKVNSDDVQALMANMFVGKKQFEAAIANITQHNKAEIKDVTEQSSHTIMNTISERITEQFTEQQKLYLAAGISSHSQETDSKSTGINSGVGLTDNQVWAIVKQAIMTYDADKTGMVDYALESAGGSVVSTRCTESYYKHTASLTLFGIPYWYPVNTPRTVIQPGVHPGECWAFRGSYGFLVIQLAGSVRISSFSLEHIPRSLAFDGNIDSAPKDFSVWGLTTEKDLEQTELGRYTYMQNGTSLQHFIVKRTDIEPFKLIELRIDSNHGNLEYTCLYRFRVHGTWVSY